MKAVVIILFAVAAVECRKYIPINKNANVDFINMESGGQRPPGPARPATGPAPVNTVPASPTPAPAKAPSAPQSPKTPESVPQSPKSPSPPATPVASPKPIDQKQPPVAPKPQPTQLDLKPVPSKSGPGAGPSTPGYGKVKDLVTYYDSQGKGSVIRPYTYSQAVKQG